MKVTDGGDIPICVKDFESVASRSLDQNAWDYYRSGADAEQTLRDNEVAFQRYRLRPRVLRDVSRVNIATSVLGNNISFPVCIAPTAMQRMAHPQGEKATAKAAAKSGVLMTLSTLSTTSLEDVAQAGAPFNGPGYWFQLYIYNDRSVTKTLVERAERAGYSALVLTVDTPMLGEDAKIAVSIGVAGIVVSNHGARQLDGVLATIDVLSEVVEAVQGRCEVYMDGGIRCGTDVFKALALGAKAVFIGRPVLWGLAYDGENGVLKVLEMLKNELHLAMMLCGCTSISEIDSSYVIKTSRL